METRYYYSKTHYQGFGTLTEVRGKVTAKLFIVKSTVPIFGNVTWDIRIPLDSSYLFTDRAKAIAFMRERLGEQLEELEEEIKYAEDFLLGGA